MRRSLILTDERSSHPFLASLPPHVRLGAAPLAVARKGGITMQDLREFLMAYCACFMAVSLYIA
jgi:hypothetical protein